MADISLQLVALGNKPEHTIIVGMSHFIKTVEDVHELVVNCVPGATFGLAFCEASGPRLIRTSGTSQAVVNEAVRMATLIGAGHSFVLVLKNIYPIQILPRLKHVPEVVAVFCATANPVQVVVAETSQGRGIMGVIDGGTPAGVETTEDEKGRKRFLRDIGYKL